VVIHVITLKPGLRHRQAFDALARAGSASAVVAYTGVNVSLDKETQWRAYVSACWSRPAGW
jgi:hypothetical protein